MFRLRLTVLVALLFIASTAHADTLLQLDGWTITYHITGETSSHYYGEGTYLFMSPQGVVYLSQGGNWVFQGYLTEVTLPPGFPQIGFEAGGLGVQVVVVPAPPPPPPPAPVVQAPAPPSTCTRTATLPTGFVLTSGGDTEEIVGPFPTAARAEQFASRRCTGDWTVVPSRRPR